MSTPTFLHTPDTQASDSVASTTHQITMSNPIRQRGLTIGPSSILFAIVIDNSSGGIGTSVTDTNGNVYTRKTDDPNVANGFSLEVWEAHNCNGGLPAPTITWTGSASVKAKMIAAEQDQVAPVSPLDGTSTPFDQSTHRVDTTSSTSRTSAASNSTKRVGMIEVIVGFIGWNDTRTISSAGSTWTGVTQLSGGSTNLGIGIERKSAEVKNINGVNTIARFTMSATGTQPASVSCLAFFRDGVQTSTDEDGTLDNIEGVLSVYTNLTSNIVYRSSASAPNGGTGGSEYSQYAAFFPRYYSLTGVTLGATPDLRFNLLSGYDDGGGYFAFYLKTFKSNQMGSTLDSTDENASFDQQYELSIDANISGEKSVAMSLANDINQTGVTAIKLTEEGDGLGTGTSNYMEVGDYSGSVPAYIIHTLNYPVGKTDIQIML